MYLSVSGKAQHELLRGGCAKGSPTLEKGLVCPSWLKSLEL